ncbi:hypothetical protein LWI29_006887 [Acer saccharum]|uniref:Uncharacterized protein n=1 Tax=Acer saccharum TaxID=4024 RepID=A0AA39VB62_ACESA|nr:hypothetical protein LWI29_006887 [Acer saccharum]
MNMCMDSSSSSTSSASMQTMATTAAVAAAGSIVLDDPFSMLENRFDMTGVPCLFNSNVPALSHHHDHDHQVDDVGDHGLAFYGDHYYGVFEQSKMGLEADFSLLPPLESTTSRSVEENTNGANISNNNNKGMDQMKSNNNHHYNNNSCFNNNTADENNNLHEGFKVGDMFGSSSMDCEDQDTLMFHSYPCAYYVQSPSTISYANSAADIRNINTTIESDFHSPTRSETTTAIGATTFLNKGNLEASRMITLSRYSSSRGSNNNSNFLHENKKVVNITDVDDHDGPAVSEMSGQNRLIIVDRRHDDREKDDDIDHDDDDEDWYYGSGKKGLWWRYFSFKRSNSCAWISLQISWRLFLSLGVSLLVFYMATKPPPPMVSIKVQYSL